MPTWKDIDGVLAASERILKIVCDEFLTKEKEAAADQTVAIEACAVDGRAVSEMSISNESQAEDHAGIEKPLGAR